MITREAFDKVGTDIKCTKNVEFPQNVVNNIVKVIGVESTCSVLGSHLSPECTLQGITVLAIRRVTSVWPQSTCIGHSLPVLATVFLYWPQFTCFGQSTCISHSLPVLAAIYLYWPQSTCIIHSVPVLATVYLYNHGVPVLAAV